MSFVDGIKNMWYRNSGADVYDTSDDFDELWKMEEQDSSPSTNSAGTFLNKVISRKEKGNGIGYQAMKERENTNVIEHPSITPQSEVLVIEPRSFDDALEIVEELRSRRSVVLNLQYLDQEQSQRVVDFLAGATHAVDGHQQRIGQGVFIFAPSNFTITSESQEARALKDAFWGRAKEREESQQSQYQFSEPIGKKSSIF